MHDKFFAVVGIFVVGVTSLIMFLGFGALFSGCMTGLFFADEQRRNAEEEARVWASEMYPDATEGDVHVVCQGDDSDGNGYVTCSARIGDERVPLECYAYVWMNVGGNTCREVIPVRAYQQPSRR